MDNAIVNGFETLDLNVESEGQAVNRCFLFEIPAELRIEIYEHVLRQNPAVIVVDLRDHDQDQRQPPRQRQREPLGSHWQYALTMACKQIHKETFKIRYQVNAVHIFAPVFIPDPSNHPVEKRGIIIERLQGLATRQARTKQLSKVKVFLGRMPSLGHIRWMDFFMRWNAVVPALLALRDCVPALKVSFEAKLSKDQAARFQFGVNRAEDVEKGMERGILADGSTAELTDREAERLVKVKMTVVRTLFEGPSGKCSRSGANIVNVNVS